MKQKALFLDRDGVVNRDIGYLHKEEDFVFIDGIFELCLHFQKLGFLIFVITNQSGIARGYYSIDQFIKLSAWMQNKFLLNGVTVNKVYFCPHLPEISGECSCRKPNPGMILEASREFDLDLSESVLVGDKESDIEAGINAGIGFNYLFSSSGLVASKATKCFLKFEEIYRADTK